MRGRQRVPCRRGLYRYIAERGAEAEDLVVELEGRLSGERDLDADADALLVNPTRIVATHPFDHERLQELRARVRS